MIYKDFVAEAAQKIMALQLQPLDLSGEFSVKETERVKEMARGSVAAAKYLADALEEDFNEDSVDGVHRYAETETFFDNYVNWTKTK